MRVYLNYTEMVSAPVHCVKVLELCGVLQRELLTIFSDGMIVSVSAC